MKTYLLLIMFFFSSPSILYSQWELRTNELPDWSVADPLDISEDSTVAIFVRTSYLPSPMNVSFDLGKSWTSLITPNTYEGTDISLIDKGNIWFCTDNGKIFYTSNGGMDWILQFNDTLNLPFLNYIKFFDKDNGIVVGDAVKYNLPAVILSTTDGGHNWNSINDSSLIGVTSRDVFYPIEFPAIDVGYYCDFATNILYKTIDGGVTWQKVNLHQEVKKVDMIKFYDKDIGILITANYTGDNFLFRTLNGGDSWTKLSFITTYSLHDIEFLPSSPSKIWLTNHDNLYFSADTGNTWQECIVTTGDLEARNIEFMDDSIGFILCDNGKFYATENNGGIVTDIRSNELLIPKNVALYQNYPNPFNPSTKIKYQIPVERLVQLKVYNILGTELETLVNEVQQAGEYSENFNAKNLASGVYIYKLIAGEFVKTKKMVLLK